MSHKKKAEDSHLVTTEEERKARKEHESAAKASGFKATLDKGRLMDAMHNEGVSAEVVKGFEVFLEEMERGESVPVTIDVVDDDKVVYSTGTQIDLTRTDGNTTIDTTQAQEDIKKLQEEVEAVTVENETLTELEKLIAQVEELKKKLAEKEAEE